MTDQDFVASIFALLAGLALVLGLALYHQHKHGDDKEVFRRRRGTDKPMDEYHDEYEDESI